MEVELTTQVEGGFRPTIKASSNLPDGMKLLVRVRRKESAFQLETPVEGKRHLKTVLRYSG